jgi:hypothetical protein
MESEEWSHEAIILKPLSYNSDYKDIELSNDELINFTVAGIFERVLI